MAAKLPRPITARAAPEAASGPDARVPGTPSHARRTAATTAWVLADHRPSQARGSPVFPQPPCEKPGLVDGLKAVIKVAHPAVETAQLSAICNQSSRDCNFQDRHGTDQRQRTDHGVPFPNTFQSLRFRISQTSPIPIVDHDDDISAALDKNNSVSDHHDFTEVLETTNSLLKGHPRRALDDGTETIGAVVFPNGEPTASPQFPQNACSGGESAVPRSLALNLVMDRSRHRQRPDNTDEKAFLIRGEEGEDGARVEDDGQGHAPSSSSRSASRSARSSDGAGRLSGTAQAGSTGGGCTPALVNSPRTSSVGSPRSADSLCRETTPRR